MEEESIILRVPRHLGSSINQITTWLYWSDCCRVSACGQIFINGCDAKYKITGKLSAYANLSVGFYIGVFKVAT